MNLLRGILFSVLVYSLSGCRPQPGEHEMARQRMIEQDLKGRGIRHPAVLRAMAAVPRERFVHEQDQARAYADHPLPIGQDQTISQPYIVAAMTEALDPEPDDIILEVGTGSGYQAAVLGQIVAEVYSIEIVAELATRARETLRQLDTPNIHCRLGDGYAGWPEAAPFDGILVTAAPDHLPAPLVEQLKVGARLVIPIGAVSEVQQLQVYTKQNDGSLLIETLMPVRFVPLTGDHGQ